jgi:hypothetical protein
MEAVHSSETLLNFYQTNKCFISEYSCLHRLHTAYSLLGSCWHCSPESWTYMCQATWRSIPDDSTLRELSCPSASCCFLSWLSLRPQRWRQCVSPKGQWAISRLPDVTLQHIVPFVSPEMVYVKINFLWGETTIWSAKLLNVNLDLFVAVFCFIYFTQTYFMHCWTLCIFILYSVTKIAETWLWKWAYYLQCVRFCLFLFLCVFTLNVKYNVIEFSRVPGICENR